MHNSDRIWKVFRKDGRYSLLGLTAINKLLVPKNKAYSKIVIVKSI